MEAWLTILLIIFILLIIAGVIILIIWLARRREEEDRPPPPSRGTGLEPLTTPGGGLQPISPVTNPMGPSPVVPPSLVPLESFQKQQGGCAGTQGVVWNIASRPSTLQECESYCLRNAVPNLTPPQGWKQCTGVQLGGSSYPSGTCVLFDYSDIRGNGTNDGTCYVLKQ